MEGVHVKKGQLCFVKGSCLPKVPSSFTVHGHLLMRPRTQLSCWSVIRIAWLIIPSCVGVPVVLVALRDVLPKYSKMFLQVLAR